MKLLVFSDTHGKTNSAIDIIKYHNDVDAIIHLGDLVRDAEEILSNFSNIKMEYIPGNNDILSTVSQEKIIDIGGKKLLLTHGHKYRVKNELNSIKKRGKDLKVDGVLFGHTHISHEDIDNNILYFNPGSLTLPRNKPSYGMLEIRNGNLYSMICNY